MRRQPVQNSPSTPSSTATRYKTRPTRPKSPNLARFTHAGRVLSRFHHQQATQGELFTAHPQRHHRHDRNNTPTQHTQPRDEILFAHAPHTAPHNETFTAQHAINNQNSPIFTMQGRSFFHNTHHTPTPGRHFFQPTGPGPHQTQAAHNSTTTGAQHCEPAGTNRRPERNCPRHHLDSGARPQKSRT